MSERPMKSIGSNGNPWSPKHRPQHCNEKTNICAFLDEEISIEAKVKINPNVSIGNVKVECLESSVDPHSKHNHSSEECTVYVNQLVRIKIPVHFSAKVKAEDCGVICHHCPDEPSH